MNCEINFNIDSKFKDVRIYVPTTVVLATDIFDQFMEENDLTNFALKFDDDEKIKRAFIDAPKFPYKALKSINEKEKQPFIFYLHPWEIDPGQPRMSNISLLSRFRHYNNLNKTSGRFEKLLDDFQFCPIAGERKNET